MGNFLPHQHNLLVLFLFLFLLLLVVGLFERRVLVNSICFYQ